MREYKPPRKRSAGDHASLWVPITCEGCKRVKQNEEGQSLYRDLLAPPRPIPRSWEWWCAECQAARDGLRALGGEVGPVEDTF
jgi:hypothetical protein